MGGPLADGELIERAKGGDTDAYKTLVRRHQDSVFRTAYAITGSAADAEEVTQDAFVKAHRALGRFRRGSPFRPWILKIVANEARNRRVSVGRRQALALRLADDPPSGGAAPSSESAAIAAEERRALLRAIAGLREEERLIVVSRHLLGLSEEETAAVLGVRVGTVKSRLSRALERLRAELEARNG